MALFRLNVIWDDPSSNTIVYKYPFKKQGRELNNKSSLTVKESQCAIFVHKGEICDVFGPGLYDLNTDIFPILTKAAAWKFAFETPITCDVYYVNTKQFTNIKWGTKNPIMMRDPEFGVIRVRGFGAFAFKVDDPSIFMRELFGTNSSFKTEDITDFLKTMLVSSLADCLGESRVSALDLAANTLEFNEIVKRTIQEKFKSIGLMLTNLFIENMSVPEEVEKAIDERSRLGILGDSTDTLMKISAADAMKSAAKNPGTGGMFAGMGVGLGVGAGVGGYMGQAFTQGVNNQSQSSANQKLGGAPAAQSAGGTKCSCGAMVPNGAKFCPECGKKVEAPKNKFCPNCGAQTAPGAKFCPECGQKLQ